MNATFPTNLVQRNGRRKPLRFFGTQEALTYFRPASLLLHLARMIDEEKNRVIRYASICSPP